MDAELKLAIAKMKSFPTVYCPNITLDVRKDYNDTLNVLIKKENKMEAFEIVESLRKDFENYGEGQAITTKHGHHEYTQEYAEWMEKTLVRAAQEKGIGNTSPNKRQNRKRLAV